MSPTRRRLGLAAAATAPLVLGATGTARAAGHRAPARTRYLAGDSTAAPKDAGEAPETGRGMALPFFLLPGVTVADHAVDGRSPKSFPDEGRLDAVLALIRPGDLPLVRFGHNDEKAADPADPARHTEPRTPYQECLRHYVTGARSRGAGPVLATPAERRGLDAAGDALPTHGDPRRPPGGHARAGRAGAAAHPGTGPARRRPAARGRSGVLDTWPPAPRS